VKRLPGNPETWEAIYKRAFTANNSHNLLNPYSQPPDHTPEYLVGVELWVCKDKETLTIPDDINDGPTWSPLPYEHIVNPGIQELWKNIWSSDLVEMNDPARFTMKDNPVLSPDETRDSALYGIKRYLDEEEQVWVPEGHMPALSLEENLSLIELRNLSISIFFIRKRDYAVFQITNKSVHDEFTGQYVWDINFLDHVDHASTALSAYSLDVQVDFDFTPEIPNSDPDISEADVQVTKHLTKTRNPAPIMSLI